MRVPIVSKGYKTASETAPETAPAITFATIFSGKQHRVKSMYTDGHNIRGVHAFGIPT